LGVTLAADGDRLRFRPRDKVTGELLDRLRAHKSDLLAMLRAGNRYETHGTTAETVVSPAVPQAAVAAPRPRSTVPVPVEWPAAAADFCWLLAPDDLSPVPFRLNAWTEVRDAGKMLRWLRADIGRGPSGPRAFYGAMQRDLQDLQRFALAAADERQRKSHRMPQDERGRAAMTQTSDSGPMR
ncbi:MAG: hypothetical protein HUU20_25420, partial [Pirellulales bacterium]|nr:hypothetical protein [Pirellulales bacterium]